MATFAHRHQFVLSGVIVFGILLFVVREPIARAQASAASAPARDGAALTISGDVQKSLSISSDDLKHLPRKTIHVKNEHADKEEVYEGVLLSVLLKQAGAPQGAQIRGKLMVSYVLAEGSDGYQVLFSLPELDSDFEESEVLVADTMDGAPIPGNLGPLRLVVPHDKRPARWVRMLQSIQVVKVSK
jgi:DMSO/TMAO reductase YedYZ molybdopterin-dependent catalytic subunit